MAVRPLFTAAVHCEPSHAQNRLMREAWLYGHAQPRHTHQVQPATVALSLPQKHGRGGEADSEGRRVSMGRKGTHETTHAFFPDWVRRHRGKFREQLSH